MGKYGAYTLVPAAAGQYALVKDGVTTNRIDIGDLLGGGGGGPSNIAFISVAYGVDTPADHTYATLRGAYDNEPAGSVWIFKGDGDVFEVDNSAPMNFQNITFLTEFASGAIFINLNESIEGMLNIPYPNFLFYVTSSISYINLQCRNTYFQLFLQNATASVINTVSFAFLQGTNTLVLGDEFYSIAPHTEYIEELTVIAYGSNLHIPIMQADKIDIQSTYNSKIYTGAAPCAYVRVMCDPTSEVICEDGSGFAITSYVGTPPVSSPQCFLTPYIFGKARIIISVNSTITFTPDSFFDWFNVVGDEGAVYFYFSVVKGKLDLLYPDESFDFNSTNFTSGMGTSVAKTLCPFYAECDENLDVSIWIDCISELFEYADRYFWFSFRNTNSGRSPRILIRKNQQNYVYIHWHNSVIGDIDTKKFIYFTGFESLVSPEIILDDIMIARFSLDTDPRNVMLVHDHLNPGAGGAVNAKLVNGRVLCSVENNFNVYPMVGYYSGGTYADVIGWTHDIYALYFGDPSDPNKNFFVYKCRACEINYRWEGAGYILIDGVGGTDQFNTFNGICQENSGSAIFHLAIATDRNKVSNGYVDLLIFDGSYNVVTGTEITTGILDSGTDNFVDPVTNPGGNQWLELRETSTPANPAADRGRIYVKDDGTGITKLYFIDSAGLESELGRLSTSTANVSNPPTAAELNGLFTSPAAVGAGFEIFIDDNGSGTDFYRIVSDGSNWWIFTGTKAV